MTELASADKLTSWGTAIIDDLAGRHTSVVSAPVTTLPHS